MSQAKLFAIFFIFTTKKAFYSDRQKSLLKAHLPPLTFTGDIFLIQVDHVDKAHRVNNSLLLVIFVLL